jgi:hypothetical protein
MLRVTEDLVEVRRWAERHGGRPCRRLDGTLELCFVEDPAPALSVGWDEFETNFVLTRCVLVYDETPGCTRSFVGPAGEARAYIRSLDPRLSGAAGDTP